jgi:hypothetical protein
MFTGIFSGIPTAAGVFTFTVEARDLFTDALLASKEYTVTIPADVVVKSTIITSASPVAGGTTTGDGTFDNGTSVTVIATHSPGYAFVNWTENGAPVSDAAVYPFTVNGDRTLVANFVPTYTIATSASPVAGGSTSGGGTFNSGDPVTVLASANAGYSFVNWTESGVEVSASASYTFTAGANRSLLANFAINPPALSISSTTVTRNGSKVDVTVIIGNKGEEMAQAVTIGSKKDATLDGKGTQERPPVVLGNIDPGGSASTILTFAGVKAGTRTLQLKLTYTSGTATLSTPVTVP